MKRDESSAFGAQFGGDACEQHGLAHAALADDEMMLRPALWFFRGEVGDDAVKLLPPRRKGRDDLLRRHPPRVVERELMDGEHGAGALVSSDFPAMPVFAEEKGAKGVAACALQQVAVALEHEQQASELVLDGGRIGGLAGAHQRVQNLGAFAPIGVLAEMTQDVFGRRGVALARTAPPDAAATCRTG